MYPIPIVVCLILQYPGDFAKKEFSIRDEGLRYQVAKAIYGSLIRQGMDKKCVHRMLGKGGYGGSDFSGSLSVGKWEIHENYDCFMMRVTYVDGKVTNVNFGWVERRHPLEGLDFSRGSSANPTKLQYPLKIPNLFTK